MLILQTSSVGGFVDVATALNNLANLLSATNRLAEAEPLYRTARLSWWGPRKYWNDGGSRSVLAEPCR